MNRLFQLLCIFVLLLPAATAIEYSDCSNYPDADLILLLEESVRDVSYLDVPTGASLPDGWSLYRESYISDEDVIAGEEEKDYVSESNYNENNFDYRYAQLFTAADGSIVLVYIDYFKNENQPRYILEAYRKVISGARNVAEIRSTGTKYGDEGIICHVEDEYHLYFRGGSKFYMIYGNSSASIELAAKLYVSELKPILVTEKYHWMAKVCKTGTDRCTKYVYYGRDYESIDSLECKVTHGSDSTECPEDRIETTGSYIKVPFHSCSKDDILDLSYERTTTFPMAGEFWSEDFYFNRTMPADKLSLKLVVPKDMKIKYDSPPGLLVQDTEDSDTHTYVWERIKTPPYKTEVYMPPEREVADIVSYTSMDSWSNIEKWFNGLFSNAINISAVKDKTQELTKNAGTKDEKIKALYDWVRDNIRYEYSEIGIAGGYKPNPTTEVLSYKFGDCKDHTILLISMLKHLDIEAYPALVAYSDFKESDTPSLVFYHSLVAVPNGGKILWLDPTCTSCPYKYIPPSDQGSDAMIIMDNKEGFTRIDDLDVDKKQGIQVTRTVNLTSDGTAVVDYTRRETGYEAVSDAKELKDLNYDKAKEKLKDFINMICDGGELRTYNITSSDTEVGVLTIQMKVNCRKFASTSGEKIIFDLSQEPVFYDAIKEERRVFPIQLDDSITVEYTTNTILPKGYSVESVPEDFKLSESFAEYESRFSTEQGVLHAYTKTGIKEGTIPASKFYEFKKFFTDISANSKKGVILSPEGEQKAVTEASSTPTTVETTIPQATSATTLPEKSQGCTPALPAVITVALSILMGIPYTLMKK